MLVYAPVPLRQAYIHTACPVEGYGSTCCRAGEGYGSPCCIITISCIAECIHHRCRVHRYGEGCCGSCTAVQGSCYTYRCCYRTVGSIGCCVCWYIPCAAEAKAYIHTACPVEGYGSACCRAGEGYGSPCCIITISCIAECIHTWCRVDCYSEGCCHTCTAVQGSCYTYRCCYRTVGSIGCCVCWYISCAAEAKAYIHTACPVEGYGSTSCRAGEGYGSPCCIITISCIAECIHTWCRVYRYGEGCCRTCTAVQGTCYTYRCCYRTVGSIGCCVCWYIPCAAEAKAYIHTACPVEGYGSTCCRAGEGYGSPCCIITISCIAECIHHRCRVDCYSEGCCHTCTAVQGSCYTYRCCYRTVGSIGCCVCWYIPCAAEAKAYIHTACPVEGYGSTCCRAGEGLWQPLLHYYNKLHC